MENSGTGKAQMKLGDIAWRFDRHNEFIVAQYPYCYIHSHLIQGRSGSWRYEFNRFRARVRSFLIHKIICPRFQPKHELGKLIPKENLPQFSVQGLRERFKKEFGRYPSWDF